MSRTNRHPSMNGGDCSDEFTLFNSLTVECTMNYKSKSNDKLGIISSNHIYYKF